MRGGPEFESGDADKMQDWSEMVQSGKDPIETVDVLSGSLE